jgi:hypothetical protein
MGLDWSLWIEYGLGSEALTDAIPIGVVRRRKSS